MGVSSSWAQLDHKLEALARDYADLPRAQVRESTVVVKQSVDVLMPNRLRGAGKNGAAVTVHAESSGEVGRVWVTGPAQLIENDTRPHLIIPRGARGLGAGRASKARNAASLLGVAPQLSGLKIGFGRGAVLHFGDRFAAYAKHPGTKGKHPWAKGVTAAVPSVSRLFEAKSEVALRRIF